MSLRKRAVFKPNLSQALGPKAPAHLPNNGTNSEPATNEALLTGNGPPSPIKSTQPRIEPAKGTTINETPTPIGNSVELPEVNARPPEVSSPDLATNSKEIDDESSKRVHEAITQLTGQRFEPIKSVSLQNSANKNKNVKLKDLLFYNPPLTKDQKRHRKNLHFAKKNEKRRIDNQNQSTNAYSSDKDKNDSNNGVNDNHDHVEAEEPSLVPKVKMGPDGKLILDESSTIINRKNSLKEKEAIVEDNEEVISRTNYDSYRRKPASTSQTKWSVEDTQKFYQALTIFGTDFSMMESLLFSGNRSRTELHKKFKREERTNKTKIDIALSNRISLSSEELDELKDLFQKE